MKSFLSPKTPMEFTFGNINKAKKAKIKEQIQLGGAPSLTMLNSEPSPSDVGFVIMV